MLLATMANKEDSPTFDEALQSPERAGYIAAMEQEILTLCDMLVFDIVPRPPKGVKVISGVWALKKKRFPDGTVKKLKARYCARGYEQVKDVDYFESFAPVCMWITVRILLIMSILMGLETKQIDYNSAFVHADISTVTYVEMPQGFELDDKVWKLNKCLYGLVQSPRDFFQYNAKKLRACNFVPCKADPCLFIRDDAVILIYVDDALVFFRNKDTSKKLFAEMRS